MNRINFLRENISKLQVELGAHTNLIAVSKTYPASDIKLCYDLGLRDFGENKVQELYEKAIELKDSCPEIRWHMIGHLQSNKINTLLKTPNLVSIHSIDSIKLLNKLIDRITDTTIKLFLQINTSLEDEKSGFVTDEDVLTAAKLIQAQKSVKFQGLMTIGKMRTENFEEDAKLCFEKLKSLRDELERVLKLSGLELSMGMSNDYRVARNLAPN